MRDYGETDTGGDSSRARLSLLLDASTAIAGAASFKDALRRLASEAVPRLADLCLIDVVMEGGRVERLAAVHHDPSKQDLVSVLEREYGPHLGGPHPAATVIATRKSIWSESMTPEFLRATTRDERHLEIVTALEFTSFMSVPLMAGPDLIGVMTLVSAGSGRRFQEADLAWPEELADRLSELVREIRIHDRDRYIARALQARLLPRAIPAVDGLEVAHRYLTGARDVEVGGDFYDLVVLPSGRFGIAVGDVAGHDPDAAAMMGQLRSAVRALAGQLREPAPLVDALQWSWDLLGFDRISTLFLGRIDLERQRLVAVSAGHPPPILIREGGRVQLLPIEPGPPLGCSYYGAKEFVLALQTGDVLLLYTDGLIEKRHGSLADGLDQLLDRCREAADLPIEQLADVVIDGLVDERELQDDVALMAVRFVGIDPDRRPSG